MDIAFRGHLLSKDGCLSALLSRCAVAPELFSSFLLFPQTETQVSTKTLFLALKSSEN